MADSANNVIPISTNRNKIKFQNLIKKKTRLLKNVSLLAPSLSLNESSITEACGPVLNMADLENEIDNLVK